MTPEGKDHFSCEAGMFHWRCFCLWWQIKTAKFVP